MILRPAGMDPAVASELPGKWRRYPAVPVREVIGIEAAQAARTMLADKRKRSLEWQAEQQRTTGFPGGEPEIGHAVRACLRRKGYGHTIADVGAHLAAVGTSWNWQGVTRIARWIGRSLRTVRRARARLEADGLIRSHLLLAGERIPEQQAPVWRPQVVRDVSLLQRLVRTAAGGSQRGSPPRESQRKPAAASRPARPSVAEPPPPPPPPEIFEAAAGRVPWLADVLGSLAAAARRKPPPPPSAAPPPTPEEIDAWDCETECLERDLEEDRRRRGGRDGPD